jgi:hypothetical protein
MACMSPLAVEPSVSASLLPQSAGAAQSEGGGGGAAVSWRAEASISQLTRNTAAITGPMTKPLRPNTTMPPSVVTSTR